MHIYVKYSIKSQNFKKWILQGRKYSADGKAELAFKVFDKNHDGYITKGEMLKVSKNLTKEQVGKCLKCLEKK